MSDEKIELVIEISLRGPLERQLAVLLDQCFPNTFEGRSYFKQIPHARVLMWRGNSLIGYAGLDHRVIRIGDAVTRVTGIVDLCVDPSYWHIGRGSALLQFAETLARGGQSTFMILFADRTDLYLRNGYRAIEPAVLTWLAIEERTSHSMQRRDFSGTFMVKEITDIAFPSGEIDLLGYLF